jgi:hypothetical protein
MYLMLILQTIQTISYCIKKHQQLLKKLALKSNNLPLTPEYKTMSKYFKFLVIQNRISVNYQKILCAKNKTWNLINKTTTK